MNDKELTQTDTKAITYAPSNRMNLWMEVASQYKLHRPTEIAEKCAEIFNSHPEAWRTHYYKERRKPGFVEWQLSQWQKLIREYGPELDIIGMKNSTKDFRYWEAMQKRVGNLKDADNKVAVQVNNVISDKKDQYGI